jgi:hypothetical protein
MQACSDAATSGRSSASSVGGEHDIGQSLAVQAQHAKPDAFINQPAHTLRELILVGQKRNQHVYLTLDAAFNYRLSLDQTRKCD